MFRVAIRASSAGLAFLALAACAHTAPPGPEGVADLGAEPPGGAKAARPQALSSRSSIAELCANAQAKAVLDRDLPGLTARPEFDLFKHMSLRTLKSMSGGRLTDADVAKVDVDLAKLPPETTRTTAALAP